MMAFIFFFYVILFVFTLISKSAFLDIFCITIWSTISVISIVKILSKKYGHFISFAWAIIITFAVPSSIGAISLVTFGYNTFVRIIQFWSTPFSILCILKRLHCSFNFCKLGLNLRSWIRSSMKIFSISDANLLFLYTVVYLIAKILMIRLLMFHSSTESILFFWTSFGFFMFDFILLYLLSQLMLGLLLYQVNVALRFKRNLIISYGLLAFDFFLSHCIYPIVYGTLYGGDVWRHLGNIGEIIRNGNYGPYILGPGEWTKLDRNNLINGRPTGKYYIEILGLPVPYSLVSDKLSYSYFYSFVLFLTGAKGINDAVFLSMKWLSVSLWSVTFPMFVLSSLEIATKHNLTRNSKIWLYLPFLQSSFYFINIYAGLPCVPISFSVSIMLIPTMVLLMNHNLNFKEYSMLIFLSFFTHISCALSIITFIIIRELKPKIFNNITKKNWRIIFTALFIFMCSFLPIFLDTFENRTSFVNLEIKNVILQVGFYLSTLPFLKNFASMHDSFYKAVSYKISLTESIFPLLVSFHVISVTFNFLIILLGSYCMLRYFYNKRFSFVPLYYIVVLLSAFISFHLMRGARPVSLRLNLSRDVTLFVITIFGLIFFTTGSKFFHWKLKLNMKRVYHVTLFILLGINSIFTIFLEPIGYNVSENEINTAIGILEQDSNVSILASPLCLLSLRGITANQFYYGGFVVKGKQDVEKVLNSLYLEFLSGKIKISKLKKYTNTSKCYIIINTDLYGKVKLDDISYFSIEEADLMDIYNDDETFWEPYLFGEGNFTTELSEELIEKFNGTSSLQIRILPGNYKYTGLKHTYESYQDWSSKEFLCFYFYGTNSGRTWRVRIFAPNCENCFVYHFIDNWNGWKFLVIPLSEFSYIGTPKWTAVKSLNIYYEPITSHIYYIDYVFTASLSWGIETYNTGNVFDNILVYELTFESDA